MVINEAAVENTTSFTENSSSQSYLEASIVVVAPAGIAARSTLTPLTRLSKYHSNYKHGHCRITVTYRSNRFL